MASAYRRHRRYGLFKDVILTICLLVLLGLIAVRLQGGEATLLNGPFRVVDGDTLAVGGERLRLSGIDAPELDQICRRNGEDWPCGVEAKAALQRLISSGAIECRGSEDDRYRRLLVSCFRDGETVNGAMVRSGMALATALVTFRREQMSAETDRRGIWAGEFVAPKVWRDGKGRHEEGDRPSGVIDRMRDVLSLGWL